VRARGGWAVWEGKARVGFFRPRGRAGTAMPPSLPSLLLAAVYAASSGGERAVRSSLAYYCLVSYALREGLRAPSHRRLRDALYRLKRAGLVEGAGRRWSRLVRLTPAGRALVEREPELRAAAEKMRVSAELAAGADGALRPWEAAVAAAVLALARRDGGWAAAGKVYETAALLGEVAFGRRPAGVTLRHAALALERAGLLRRVWRGRLRLLQATPVLSELAERDALLWLLLELAP